MNRRCQTIVVAGLLLNAVPAFAQDAARGAETYKLCASCHGFEGEGNRLVNAPSLAGQEDWYLTRQIRNFRDGIRGAADDDDHGRTMAKMTLAIEGDGDIGDLVAYIATLPQAKPEPTLEGDADSGRSHYEACAACHGTEAQGNAALNAPGLAFMDDWYQLAQLRKFKDGRRGSAREDVYGQQMAPMAAVLVDEAALHDVVAYISSLR